LEKRAGHLAGSFLSEYADRNAGLRKGGRLNMRARTTVIGLGALLFSAFAAQSAMAVSQTAVTCTTTGSQVGTEKFSDEHCKTKNGTTGPVYHVAFSEKTEFEGTNNTTGGEREPTFVRATIGGLETIVEAKSMTTSGTIENGLSETEMVATGNSSTIKFSEISVTNRTCEFVGINPGGSETVGSLETQPIVGTTKGQAVGVVKFEPQAGSSAKFAEFKLSGASCPVALTGAYPVFGTILSNASEGATRPISHNTVTGEPAPKLRLKNAVSGPVAGLSGKFTTRGGPVGSEKSTWRPLSVT
jgi:hypothetical protein